MEQIAIDPISIKQQHAALEAAEGSGCQITNLVLTMPTEREKDEDRHAQPTIGCSIWFNSTEVGRFHGKLSGFILLCSLLKSGTLPRPREAGRDHGWGDPR